MSPSKVCFMCGAVGSAQRAAPGWLLVDGRPICVECREERDWLRRLKAALAVRVR
jgi:hypothetical protein